jgi:hypothetical protein
MNNFERTNIGVNTQSRRMWVWFSIEWRIHRLYSQTRISVSKHEVRGIILQYLDDRCYRRQYPRLSIVIGRFEEHRRAIYVRQCKTSVRAPIESFTTHSLGESYVVFTRLAVTSRTLFSYVYIVSLVYATHCPSFGKFVYTNHVACV